jgi:methyl-accepting chemotaxis protein WspA
VRESGVQLISTISEIGVTVRNQEVAVNDFGQSTNEIATAAKEISVTSQELVNTMGGVTQLSDQTATLADSGRSGLINMEETMKQLAKASGSISSRLGVMNEKANNISSVITTIAEIADQTNLLSLNAAIEAEKAGEYGHGFSVVAREIRRLADQTAVATQDIEEMVKEMQSAVSSGVMEMDKFSEAVRHGVRDAGYISEQLGQIIEQVKALTPRFAMVNGGMQSQALGAQQISRAMLQLNEAAHRTSLSLRDLNSVTELLSDAVRSLEEEIAQFKIDESVK